MKKLIEQISELVPVGIALIASSALIAWVCYLITMVVLSFCRLIDRILS